MAELWPTSLPQRLNVQGHSYNFGDPTIRSNPAVGPSKVRPRSSAVSAPLNGQMYLTTAQLAALRTFYQITVRGADVFIFPDPEMSATTFIKSVYEVIQTAGQTSNLKMLLEAGDVNSWPGNISNKWLDESGNGTDFFLGLDGSVAASDPTFVGTVDGLNLNNYWSFDGGDWFTYDAANEAWMNNIHKDNAKFTIITVVYIPSLGSVFHRFAGTTGAATEVGFQFYVDNANKPTFLTSNAATVNYFLAASLANLIVPTVGWHTFGVSVDEAASSGILMMDGFTQAFAGAYPSPSAANATRIMNIAAMGTGIGPMTAGGRMATFMAWEGRALTAAELTAVQQALGQNYALPSVNYLNCRFVTPPSISATVKAGLWSASLAMEIVP